MFGKAKMRSKSFERALAASARSKLFDSYISSQHNAGYAWYA